MVKRIIIAVLLSTPLFAQYYYYGERPLEQSFENETFFFNSNHVNPFGMKEFSSVTPGLINNPLLNLQINPANILYDSLSSNYIYLDFRTSREISREYPVYVQPYMSVDRVMPPYPQFFAMEKRFIEPALSGVYFTHPFSSVPQLSVGATYQMIFQNENYYYLPQQGYRNELMADVRNLTQSIDKNTDYMKHQGHFGSFYLGYEVNHQINAGIRFNRSIFDRKGVLGAENSIYNNMESRLQDYNHWDVATGVQYNFSTNSSIGITTGYLWGTAKQSLLQNNNSNPIVSNSQSNNDKTQRWLHDGYKLYGSIDFSSRIAENKKITIVYSASSHNMQLSSSSLSSGFSYSSYADQSNFWESKYFLDDARSGNGKKNVITHQISPSLQWIPNEELTLNLGLSVELLSSHVSTTEKITTSRFYYNAGTNYYYIDSLAEKKNLPWKFDVLLNTVQLPIIFQWKTSDAIELIFGINNQFITREINEITTEDIQYRTTNQNGVITTINNVKQEYVSPTTYIDESKTTLLFGTKLSPMPLMDIQFLALPSHTYLWNGAKQINFQWWLGINLHP